MMQMTEFFINAAGVISLYTMYETAVDGLIRSRREKRIHMKPKIMGIPPKTTLQMITRMDDQWILTTVHSRTSEPFVQRLILRDDGTAHRIDIRSNGMEDTQRIM